MQTISGLLFGLCFAAALGAIVRMLAPEGGTQKLVRLCTALFVLATALRPIQQTLQTIPGVQMREGVADAAEAVMENARTAILRSAQNVLDAHGVSQAQIHVDMTVRDGEVHALTFVITGVPAEQAQEIEDEIFALTGERPRMEADP